MGALLRTNGWSVNDKRVARVWRESGLRVPRRQIRRRRLGHSANGCHRHVPLRPNHVWSYDFVSDQTEDGRTLKMLVVIDEFTRECLAIHCARSIKGTDVVKVLAQLFAQRGVPGHVRSDNGPEFIAKSVRAFLERLEVGPLYIQPGSPWENGYCESFNGKFRDEFLDRELLGNLKEAKILIENWRIAYNTVRPHSALGYLAPVAYAKTVHNRQINA